MKQICKCIKCKCKAKIYKFWKHKRHLCDLDFDNEFSSMTTKEKFSGMTSINEKNDKWNFNKVKIFYSVEDLLKE